MVFKYEPYFCNGCNDLMQKVINLNDADIVSIKGSDYRIHFWYMSKDDVMNIMKSTNLNEKVDYYIFIEYKNEWRNLSLKKQRNNIK